MLHFSMGIVGLCRVLALVVFLFVPASLVWAQVQVPTENGNYKLYDRSLALVVGISSYQDDAWNDLPSIKSEMNEVMRVLDAQGFAVEPHIGEVTSQALVGILQKFLSKRPGRDSRMLVFRGIAFGSGWSRRSFLT